MTTDLDDPLKRLLATHDAPCPQCGRNLRGSESSVCPECGEPFTFDKLVGPRRWCSVAWALLLCAWAAALPWSLFGVWQRLPFRRAFFYGSYEFDGDDYVSLDASWTNPWFVLSSTFWLGVPVVVGAIIRSRRRIEAWPTWARCAVAALSVVLVVVAFRRWQWWYYDLNPQKWPVDDFWYLDPRNRGLP